MGMIGEPQKIIIAEPMMEPVPILEPEKEPVVVEPEKEPAVVPA